jgi:hypothetical protein
MNNDIDFSGTWHCKYWYPSNNHDGDDVSEYDMTVHQKGNELVFESVPTEGGDYMLVRLVLDADLATGTWHETTSPQGEFKGAMYSGAGQMIFDPAKMKFEGKWAGMGLDHELGKTRIYSGDWELVRVGVE